MIELFPGYCIDTNALIDLWRRVYPVDVFETLWEKIEQLISQGRLIAPREVLRELEKQDDQLLAWAKKHKQMFKRLDPDQVQLVLEIQNKFRNLVDANKETPDADPFVVALAISRDLTVITSEKRVNDPNSRPKIPNVCEDYNVACLGLLEFFRKEKWKI